jgi:superfamily II DNA or RNA helicase
MLKIKIKTPTLAIIENPTLDQIKYIQKTSSYNDTSAAFALKNLSNNRWLKTNKPDIFLARKKELEQKIKNCLLKQDEHGNYVIQPGFLPYLNIPMEIENNIEYPKSKKIPWKKPLPYELYPYQKQAVERLIEKKHGCVSLATGCGKTFIILSLARELGLKTVIVTPSKSIFLEIFHQLETHFGKSLVGAYGDGKKKLDKQITVCISKSLTSLKPGSKEYDFFQSQQVVISDESHLNAAETLEEVFHGVLSQVPYRFFLSGTQTRGDGKFELLYSIIGECVIELNTKNAIEGGYICPVKFNVIETTSPIKQEFKNTKDTLTTKRHHFLYNPNITSITANIANASWKRLQESTLILVEELSQIKALTELLTVPYDYVHSASKAEAQKVGLDTKKVDEVVESFNKGEIKVLIGTSCIATGTNIYPTHNTVNWVGGSSEVKTKQGTIGRSVRKLDLSKYKEFHKPKPYSKIFDFRVSNVETLEILLKKRLSMYTEICDTINFINL